MSHPVPRFPADGSPCPASSDALRGRWERLHWQIRCGLPPLEPARVRLYVHLGLKLARRSGDGSLALHRRVLANLLAVARDEALPWAWRCAGLEHVNLPLAFITSALGPRHPEALRGLLAEVELARVGLPALP